jgi:membrane peptidoglycan carboxypeptidase
MVTAERLTQAEADAANAEPLNTSAHDLPNGCSQSPYPYYCQWVKQVLLDDVAFGADAPARERNLYAGGFKVQTALEPTAMAAAQSSVDAAFNHDNQAAAAIAVVEPGTGHVPAIAQSRGYDQTQFIYPVQAQVQPGSTFKPITYATALEEGFDPASTLGSSAPYSPAGMNAPKGGFANAERGDRGQITASEAIKHSVNTFFVRLVEDRDREGRKHGVSAWDDLDEP